MCLNGSTRGVKGMGSKQLRGRNSSIDRSQPQAQGMNMNKMNKIRAYGLLYACKVNPCLRRGSADTTWPIKDKNPPLLWRVNMRASLFFLFLFFPQLWQLAPCGRNGIWIGWSIITHYLSIGSWFIHNPYPYPHPLLLLHIISLNEE